MARAKQLLCPNCGGPLPLVTAQTRTECAYCGRPVLLEPPPTPHVPPPTFHVSPPRPGAPYPRTSKAPLIVALVVFGLIVGIAAIIFQTVRRQVSKQSQVRFEVQRSVDEAHRTVAEAQAQAFAEVERALGELPAELGEARAQLEAARDQLERSPPVPGKRSAANKRPAPPPLPVGIDDALVEKKLAALDVSHCAGPGFIVYTFRVDPSGALKSISQGPMRVSGGSFGCVGKVVDQATKTLRFDRTRNGSGPVTRRFVLPDQADD